jgi:hypothetical protein
VLCFEGAPGKNKYQREPKIAHTLQILKIAFPPRILPKNEAMITKGNRISMIVTNRIKA